MSEKSTKSDRFPSCWDDDERMGYLFSDFRQNRTVNPNDWDNKLKFWSQLVGDCCRKDKCAVMDCEKMVEGFRRKGRLPMGINRVLREMANTGEIVSTADFSNSLNSTWFSWGIHTFLRQPLTWAVGSVFKRNEQPLTGSYIVMDVLKEISRSVLDLHQRCSNFENMDNIVEYTTVRDMCHEICSDEMTLDLALLYLQKAKSVHVETIADGSKVVKFVSKNQQTVAPLKELGIVGLRRTINSLKKQIERHQKDMNNLRDEAALMVRKGLKSSAKNILRRKKIIERLLAKKETTLDTLQQLLDQIQGAETNTMTLEAYRAGASALKQTLKANGLTPEAVDDTLSDVQEVMELCAEIDDTMSQGNKSIDESVSFSAGLDADALETELADLLAESGVTTRQTNKAGTDLLAGFPEVPETKPQSLEEDSTTETLLTS
ncbi:charged multivesicular body protein 7-like [Acanthaster planci]|uniref:Charged multivesicular body protein 7 n=1 Tax=Acanthaster planci TaxID=133434 RepID=A0A8B7Z0H6_ACAPL|nr:charged multivesicular body protein 7-like [Acanthaster planci]